MLYDVSGTAAAATTAAAAMRINYLSLSLPLSYAYTVNALYFFLVSSVDVGLVDLNHFSHNATPRCSVKNSSRFTLLFSSLSLFLHMQCERERGREWTSRLKHI